MACRSVSDPAVVVLLVIGLLVSLRVVASATRGKDGRARPERTPPRREAEKFEPLLPRRSLIRHQPGPARQCRSCYQGRGGRCGGRPNGANRDGSAKATIRAMPVSV